MLNARLTRCKQSCAHSHACRTHYLSSLTCFPTQFAKVTCGSVVKLKHVKTGYRLHSHEIKWGSGSKQQSVTAMNAMDDPNSLWIVKGAHGTHCRQGTPVENGMTVRFTHSKTQRNLHTHHFESPLTKQHEVTAYGEGGNGDHLDDWIIETRGESGWV